jgi:hypothetical protein
VIPISQGTPLPKPPFRIAFDNASQLHLLASYGKERPYEARLSEDGSRLFVANGIGVDVYDAASKELLSTIPAVADCELSLAGDVHVIQPSGDGQSVAVCSAQELRAYTLDGQMSWSLPLPAGNKAVSGKPEPTKLVISPDLKYVVFPAVGGKSEVWDPANGSGSPD